MNGRLVNWLHDGEEVVEAICRSLKFGYLRLDYLPHPHSQRVI